MNLTLIAQDEKANLSYLQLSNVTSPAFLILDETPTSVYTPENLRAFMIHSLQNLGENISIEVTPYFFLNNEGETYYKFKGIEKEADKNLSVVTSGSELKQNYFSGLGRNLTISAAFFNKEFDNIEGKHKTYSVGVRTTLFRYYNNERKASVYNKAINRAVKLSNIKQPTKIHLLTEEEIKEYYVKKYEEVEAADPEFSKTIQPIFQIDGAIGHALLFKNTEINAATLQRTSAWLTLRSSFLMFDRIGKENKNNYLNIFAIGRYVKDGFSFTNGKRNTLFYRDVGAKIELEIWRFALGYEYINRSGSENSYKSLGNLKFLLNKDITFTGGFGKDFMPNEKGITFIGINWGLNFGSDEVKLK